MGISESKYGLFDHLPLVATIVFGISSQLLMRWQVKGVGAPHNGSILKFQLLFELLMRPSVLIAMSLTFLSGISWIMTLAKFEVSYAYPWLALNFLLVPFIGIVLFGEAVTWAKVLGTFLIVIGLTILGRGR